tara:strand:+ start:3699 stop:5216 length:1518 start_codon:yes stop_codon:yes gene_type:complete
MNQIKPSQSYIDGSRAEALVNKWKPILEYSSKNVAPIEDEHTRLNTAILLENQEKWCIEQNGGAGMLNEATSTGGGAFGAGGGTQAVPGSYNQFSRDQYAPGDARLPKILIPMIRRTFPELITNEIVGVQPMSGPVGLAFALRYKYNKDGLGGGNGVDAPNAVSSPGTHTIGADYGTYTPDAPGVDNEMGYQYLDTRFTGTSSTRLSGDSAGYWNFADQDAGVAEILKNFEINANIPQVDISFEKTAVEAGTRRLGARWSVELEQDLKNMNGIDIDSEITNAMAYEIQAEIDREMLIRMIQSAFSGGFGQGYSVWSPASADGRWIAERNRDFYQRLIVEANRVAVRNRRGAANFIVATPRVCAILEMLPEFQWVPVQGNVNTQPVGVAKVGNLGGRFNVYRDTRTEVQNSTTYGNQGYTGGTGGVEYALLGYKGPEFYDTGIIYCPYIPVMVQRTIGPNDFAPRVGLLTRYGVVDNIFGAALYYHVIIVSGLGEAFTPANQSVYF